MPIFDYTCNKCGYSEEIIVSPSVKSVIPDKCPECSVGVMEKQFSVSGQSFDIIGSCYMNDYGKHAWKKRMSVSDQARVLSGEKDPY